MKINPVLKNREPRENVSGETDSGTVTYDPRFGERIAEKWPQKLLFRPLNKFLSALSNLSPCGIGFQVLYTASSTKEQERDGLM